MLIDAHYGLSTTFNSHGHPVMLRDLIEWSSAVIDVSGNTLHTRFVHGSTLANSQGTEASRETLIGSRGIIQEVVGIPQWECITGARR